MEVKNGDSGNVSSNDNLFVFTADSSVSYVVPKNGPLYGGTVVSIYGSNLVKLSGGDMNAKRDVLCKFDDIVTRAIDYNTNVVRCASPAAKNVLTPQNVKLTISSNNGTTWSDDSPAWFEYEKLVEVHSLSPNKGVTGGGTQVLVTGYRFRNETDSSSPQLLCKFGDVLSSSVVWLSEEEILCVAPPRMKGVVNVEISSNGGADFSTNYAQFTYHEPLVVTSIWPSMGGGVLGGTSISVHGSGFANEVELVCLFGNSVVDAEYFSDSLIKCSSPPNVPGLVSFKVSRDGYDGNTHFANGQHQFLYLREPSVYLVRPNKGKIQGGVAVFVTGTNFVNSTSLGCKFGSALSRGTFINVRTMVCIAPSVGLPVSNVPVTVTVNGIDYSEPSATASVGGGGGGGAVYSYLGGCPIGNYCGPRETAYRIPAPNGTYVPSGNMLNFTLCTAGSFQPKTGQGSCLPCPVGYFCPDRGLSKPVVCPAGFVCDETGLRTPVNQCRAGHFCKAGTKSNAVGIESFQCSAPNCDFWTDLLSELTVTNSSNREWEYFNRSRPATGLYTLEHPPHEEFHSVESLSDGGGGFITSLSLSPSEANEANTAGRPFSCPVGTYCGRGTVTPTPQPLNYSSPQQCFDGFFCPRGSSTPEGKGPCPTGYYCPSQVSAVVCPTGHYCPGVSNLKPLECYPGTHNPYLGQSNCTLCETGHICPGWGREYPELCPAGFVCVSLGLGSPTMICPPGYFCEEGTLTTDPSDPVKKGPRPCPAGVFCLGGVSHNITINWVPSQKLGVSAPQICTEGGYCEEVSTTPSGSGPCFPGHYCPPGTTYPVVVPIGTFASLAGSVASTLCFPGTFAPLKSSVECRTCPAGYTCQGYGTYEPRICQPGTYRALADSVTCRLCPSGTFSPYSGATDISQCLPCPAGRVCGLQGMSNLLDSVSCPQGYTCGTGTNRATQFNHRCAAGFYCADQTNPTEQYGLLCEKGHYCLRGTPLSLATRNKCNVGYFCPEGTASGNALTTKCPRRTYSLNGATSLRNCRIEQVDVCDKKTFSLDNPFEHVSYYPKHSYDLLDGEEGELKETIVFDSTREKNPTGEIEVLRKLNPINATSSSPAWKNDTVEVFRTCTPYGKEDGGDFVTVVGRNFRESDFLSCR